MLNIKQKWKLKSPHHFSRIINLLIFVTFCVFFVDVTSYKRYETLFEVGNETNDNGNIAFYTDAQCWSFTIVQSPEGCKRQIA